MIYCSCHLVFNALLNHSWGQYGGGVIERAIRTALLVRGDHDAVALLVSNDAAQVAATVRFDRIFVCFPDDMIQIPTTQPKICRVII